MKTVCGWTAAFAVDIKPKGRTMNKLTEYKDLCVRYGSLMEESRGDISQRRFDFIQSEIKLVLRQIEEIEKELLALISE